MNKNIPALRAGMFLVLINDPSFARGLFFLLIKLLEKQVFFLSHIESAHSYPSRFGL